MAQTIKIKRSATSGNKLTGSNSIAGEIGMNTADKSLYIQTGSTDASVVTVYDDSILHLDDTNNRVGIGTTSPAVPLHVDGFARFSDIQLTGTNPQVAAINNTSLVFKTNNTEVARLDASGNLGIGTTSPSYPLHVVGTGSNHQIRVERTGTGNANLGVDTTGAFVEAQSSIPLSFYQQSAERMRITGGKILINATSSTPADQLYVNGDAYITGGWRTGTAATFIGEFTNSSGKLTIQTAANRDIQLGDTANPDILYVDTSTQRVGVGTATPAQALDVVGVGKFSGTSDGSAVLKLGQRDSNATSALYTIYCDDAGSTRPLAGDLLEFSTTRWGSAIGSTRGSAAGADVRSWEFNTTGDGNGERGTHLILFNQANASSSGSTTTTSTVRISSHSGSATYFNSGSNVGIATTTPQAKLEVNLASGVSSSLMDANTVNDVQLIRAPFSSSAATTSNAGAKWGLRFVGRNDSNYDNQKSGAIYAVSEDSGAGYNRNVGLAFHTSGFDSNHTERMRISSAGVVSIYNASNSTVPTNGALRITGGLGVGYNVHAGGLVRANSGFYVNTTQIVDSSRNLVNIGTISSGHIDVTTSGVQGIRIKNDTSTTTNSGRLFFEASGGTFAIMNTANRLSFRSGATYNSSSGTERMVIKSGGQVGIGTDSPSRALELSFTGSTVGARFTRSDTTGSSTIEFANSAGVKSTVGFNAGTNKFDIQHNGAVRFSVNNSGAATFNEAFTFPTSDGQANQVLQTDGSGNVSWASVSGAGSTDAIADADGDTKIQVEESTDEDKIRFDAAGVERFRIGSDIEVIAATDFNITGANRRINFTSGTGTIRTTGASSLHLATNNTNRVTVDSSGRLGIGTTAPQELLHINGGRARIIFNGGHTSGNVTANNSTLDLYNNLQADTDEKGSIITFSDNYYDGNYVKTTRAAIKGGTDTVGNTADGFLAFYTDSSGANSMPERMRIDRQGRVGISTSSPNYLLDIESTSSALLRINNTGSNVLTSFVAQNDLGTAKFSTQSGYSRIHSGSTLTYAANTSTSIFYSSGTEQMRLTGTGLGIGTTNPLYKLQIQGANNGINLGGSGAFLRWNSGDIQIKNEGSYKMGFYTYNTANASLNQRMVLDTDGKLGINLNTPYHALSVHGASNIHAGDTSHHHNTEINWLKGNTGSSGANIWYKVADITLPDSGYSAISMEIYYETGVNNYGNHDYLDTREVFCTITRNSSSTANNSPDNAVLKGRTQDIRVYKTSTGTYELQARHASQNAAYGVRVRVFKAAPAATIVATENGSVAGTTSGGTEYTVTTAETGNDGIKHFVGQLDAQRVHLGNVDVYPSGNLNYVHLSGSGFIPQTTTASSNGSLGTSTYLWNGVFSRRFQGEVGTASVPTFTFSEDSNTGMYDEWYVQADGKRQLSFSVDGTRKMYLNEAGVWTAANFYLPTGGSLRSFGTYTDITNGTSGNGFRMRNTADSVDSLIVTSAGNGTFAGSLTVNGNIDLNGSNIIDVTQINGNGGSGWLDFDMDTDSVYPNSTTDNQTVLGSVTHMNFVGDSNSNGTGGNFYWGYGVNSTDSGTFTKTMDLDRSGNLTLTGALRGPATFTIDPAAHGDDTGTVVIAGNLQVDGTTTTINSTTLTVDDKNITLASGSTNDAAANGAGITIDCGSDTDVLFKYSGANRRMDLTHPLKISDPATRTIGGSNMGNGWLQVGDSLSMDNNEIYFNTEGYFGTIGSNPLNIRTNGSTRVYIDAVGKMGVGTTSPNAKLQVEELGIETTTTTTSATTQVAVDTFAAADFRSARYTIQVTNTTDSTYHLTEILLIHDGTTPQMTEYGTIFTGSAEATFDADISSGNVRLLATPASTDSMTFKVVRHCITV